MHVRVQRKQIPARKSKIDAYYSKGTLAIDVTGEVPSPCHYVTIERSSLAVEPPTFSLVLNTRNEGPCTAQITPYRIIRLFSIGVYREVIAVFHAEGEERVPVNKAMDPMQGVRADAGGGGDVPVPFLLPSFTLPKRDDEAVGYSDSHSFDEAFKNAVRALPDLKPYPDMLERITVVETGAEYGGIVGFSHMYVRVKREALGLKPSR